MKKQSYKKLYDEIFDERCVDGSDGFYVICNVTGVRIYKRDVTVYNFRHIKSKGSRPDLKYDKKNIEIVSAQVHLEEHSSGKVTNHLPIK